MVYYKLFRPDIGHAIYIRARHVQIINGCAIFHRDDVNEPVFAIGAGWWQSFTEVDEDLKPTCVKTHKEVEPQEPYTGHAGDCPIRLGKPCAPHCQMHQPDKQHLRQERATSAFPDNKDQPKPKPPEDRVLREDEPSPGDDKKVFDMRPPKKKRGWAGEV